MAEIKRTRRVTVVDREAFDFRMRRLDHVPPMGRQHRHNEVEINFLEAGRVTYLISGSLATVPPGKFCLFWGAVPHRIVRADADGARGFWWMTIPLAWLLSWGLPADFVGRLLDGHLCCDVSPKASDRPKLDDWLAAANNDGSGHHRPTLLEIEARCLRFATDYAGQSERPAVRPTTGELAKVERMAKYVVEHYTEAVRLADVAAAVGLNPNYAATLFRQQCGQTVLACLTEHRVAHAQRLLATTDLKTLNVALQSGFASLSRFYEAFEKTCHATPAAYRRQTRQF